VFCPLPYQPRQRCVHERSGWGAFSWFHPERAAGLGLEDGKQVARLAKGEKLLLLAGRQGVVLVATTKSCIRAISRSLKPRSKMCWAISSDSMPRSLPKTRARMVTSFSRAWVAVVLIAGPLRNYCLRLIIARPAARKETRFAFRPSPPECPPHLHPQHESEPRQGTVASDSRAGSFRRNHGGQPPGTGTQGR
jgi:hypothetical protein